MERVQTADRAGRKLVGAFAQSGLQETYECEGEFSKLSGEQDRSFILDFEADNAVFFNECKFKLRFQRNLKVRAERARGRESNEDESERTRGGGWGARRTWVGEEKRGLTTLPNRVHCVVCAPSATWQGQSGQARRSVRRPCDTPHAHGRGTPRAHSLDPQPRLAYNKR